MIKLSRKELFWFYYCQWKRLGVYEYSMWLEKRIELRPFDILRKTDLFKFPLHMRN